MIHHVSIPARDPEHVAKVLGELLGGYVGPFVALPGAWVAYEDDGHGTGFEVYPDRTAIMPGTTDDQQGWFEQREPSVPNAFHALISVKVDRATIERIGAREGWRTRHFWRGPAPDVRLFELYEFWIENRVMIEVATEDMVPAYVKLTNARAQQAVLAKAGR
jgi:hypothetical protein